MVSGAAAPFQKAKWSRVSDGRGSSRRAITDAYAIADKDERRGAVSFARRGESAAPEQPPRSPSPAPNRRSRPPPTTARPALEAAAAGCGVAAALGA
jgi:hypothetical protein